MPRPRDAMMPTLMTREWLPLSKSIASLVLRGDPPAETVRSLTVTLWVPWKLKGSVSAALFVLFLMSVAVRPGPAKVILRSGWPKRKYSDPRLKVPAVNLTVPPPAALRFRTAASPTYFREPLYVVLPLAARYEPPTLLTVK